MTFRDFSVRISALPTWLWGLIFVLLASCAIESPLVVSGQSLALVSDGVSNYTIVVESGADPVERFAAEELQKYVKQMTGVELRIADG